MADEFEQNQLIRENRANLAHIAIEAGVNPQKAAEFGSRVADNVKDMSAVPMPQGLELASVDVAAVLRNSSTGELTTAYIEIAPDGKAPNALNSMAAVIATKENGLEAIVRKAVEDVTRMPVEDVKNYSYSVSAVSTPSQSQEKDKGQSI
jgi:hypothetical protein